MPARIIPPGAIIVQVEAHKTKPGEFYANHLAIYTGVGVVHAYPNKGVHTSDLLAWDYDDDSSDGLVEVSSDRLAALVVSHTNPQVRAGIAEMANAKGFLYSPFSYNADRYKDLANRSLPANDKQEGKREFAPQEQRHRQLIALFRAVRNSIRVMQGLPISKKKGLSCDNFVAYVINAGIIRALFPNGVPESVVSAVFAIEAIRTNEANKKLDQVPVELFERFEALFLDALRAQGQNLGPNTEEIVLELYRPVKHEIIFPHMCEHKNSWQVDALVVQDASPLCVSVDVARNLPTSKLKVTAADVAEAEAKCAASSAMVHDTKMKPPA